MSIPEEERFKGTVVELLDFINTDIISDLNKRNIKIGIDKGLIILGIEAIGQFDNNEFITGFIEKSNSHWSEIKSRNEIFFIRHSGEIFKMAPLFLVKAFTDLFNQNLLSNDNKESMWEFFESMVRICIKYIHKNRHPYTENGVEYYKTPFFQNIKLKKVSEEWGVKLTF